MGGERITKYWTMEMKSVLEKYRQFETLIPAATTKGAAHRGEDGKYVESILKDTLQKFLPAGIEILTGFVLRAGVKSGYSGKARKNDEDQHSSQLDLIVYDTEHYPVYQRFGDTAVVLPEGVIAIISVKKTLYIHDIEHELQMLYNVSRLCSFEGRKGPFLALVSMGDEDSSPECFLKKICESLNKILKSGGTPRCYDSMIGFVGCLSKWSVHKLHHKEQKKADFQIYVHENEEEHIGIQFLIDGILNVYYTVNGEKKPGYICHPKNKQYMGDPFWIKYDREQSVRLESQNPCGELA